ncbi:MAG: hypothetical protein Q8M07_18590 [Prosthecobacter sp.]|nr:hypothetical protein [Prosthecobacter sp.]
MKPSSLHALVIDRHFGELTPEATELLELHLAQNADARVEAERILASLSVTHDAVLGHPELVLASVGRVWRQPARLLGYESGVPPQPAKDDRACATVVLPPGIPASQRITKKPSFIPWLARAAAIALLAGAAGFFAGRSESRMASGDVESPTQTPRKESPWAKYRMSFDPAGEGMQVVRVDTEKHKSLP